MRSIKMQQGRALLKKPLVVLAHPDDDTACCTLLQRAEAAAVVFCTDGAPFAREFWNRYGSRERYAAVRRAESRRALGLLGVDIVHFLRHPIGGQYFVDQQLFRDV